MPTTTKTAEAMPAITIWQPWASMIAAGIKTIETRTHSGFASLKGKRIAIHAGLKFDPVWRSEDALLDLASACMCDRPEQYPQGAVVATAYVSDARRLHGDDQESACCTVTDRTHGLILTDIQPVTPPVPAKGKQGIWLWEGGQA